MLRALFPRILSCIMVVVVPAALFAVDSSAAMLYTHGTTWLNGSNIPRSSAIFSGDLVQTKADSVANINALGSSVKILPDTLVQYEGDALELKHGGVTVSTSKAMGTHAGDVTVSPATSVWTEFQVTERDGKVQIAARKGDLAISDDTGTTTLPQGQQTTRDDSESQKNKKNREVGAVPAARGPILDSPVAIGIGVAAVGGLAAWVLLQGDEPVSPSKP